MNDAVIPDLVVDGTLYWPYFAWMLATTVILVLGGFAFLLVRLTRARHELWVVRCPADGKRALIRVHRAAEGYVDAIVSCSHLRSGRVVDCTRDCMPAAV